jgi:hypothetical protein
VLFFSNAPARAVAPASPTEVSKDGGASVGQIMHSKKQDSYFTTNLRKNEDTNSQPKSKDCRLVFFTNALANAAAP